MIIVQHLQEPGLTGLIITALAQPPLDLHNWRYHHNTQVCQQPGIILADIHILYIQIYFNICHIEQSTTLFSEHIIMFIVSKCRTLYRHHQLKWGLALTHLCDSIKLCNQPMLFLRPLDCIRASKSKQLDSIHSELQIDLIGPVVYRSCSFLVLTIPPNSSQID